ncbi:MAG TPA: geranylgeranyl reductase family protein [Dehalococcoidia bacterium]|nr:geranylgeranyl reductase family protein [Dehalococcoidia bacterium]
MTKYDVAVVGGGPSGSTSAHLLAKAGARVVVLDRASFPREKPCGGGVTARALAQSPVDLTPVIEQHITKVRFSFRLGDFFDYSYPKTLVYMTQRHRLDAFLLEKAGEAGADIQDGRQVRSVEIDRTGARIVVDGETIEASVLIGADGANGVVAKSVGLRPVRDPLVALEANFFYKGGGVPREWEDTLAMELGSLRGGYGWSFPKADHFNVGCGGWHKEGSHLREHLTSLKRHYGLDEIPMENVRGHHLPTRDEGAPIVRGRALLAGDAAGLVDPMSGEGIYAAFLSGRLAADATQRFLDGQAPDLYPYEAAVERELMVEMRAAQVLHDSYHYTPRACYLLMRRSNHFKVMLCQLITGEHSYSGYLNKLGPLSHILRFWASRGRASRQLATS